MAGVVSTPGVVTVLTIEVSLTFDLVLTTGVTPTVWCSFDAGVIPIASDVLHMGVVFPLVLVLHMILSMISTVLTVNVLHVFTCSYCRCCS